MRAGTRLELRERITEALEQTLWPPRRGELPAVRRLAHNEALRAADAVLGLLEDAFDEEYVRGQDSAFDVEKN